MKTATTRRRKGGYMSLIGEQQNRRERQYAQQDKYCRSGHDAVIFVL